MRLFVRGELGFGPRVAVVGTRRADAYGLDVARRVARDAAGAGWTVVSGGAYGIDKAAHEAALDAGGRTVVVLGSGLDRPAPTAHRPLFERAARQGAVVSPFGADERAGPWTFPRRNPCIAALAQVTVVVQAPRRSGALQTARAALRLGRPVYVAPGPLDSPLHAGCHALVERGARLLGGIGAWRGAEAVELPAEAEPEVPLWAAASAEATPLAELAARARLPVEDAARQATLLELRGWLRSSPGGRYARAR